MFLSRARTSTSCLDNAQCSQCFVSSYKAGPRIALIPGHRTLGNPKMTPRCARARRKTRSSEGSARNFRWTGPVLRRLSMKHSVKFVAQPSYTPNIHVVTEYNTLVWLVVYSQVNGFKLKAKVLDCGSCCTVHQPP